METFIAIILVIIMIIYDSNIIEKFTKNKETFYTPYVVPETGIVSANIVPENILPENNPLLINKTHIWIFIKIEYSARSWSNEINRKQPITKLEQLCIDTVRRHMPTYNIHVITQKNIPKIIPEHLKNIEACNSFYMTYNYIKYAILNKYGGIWLPSSTIIVKPLRDMINIRRNKLITFSINNTQLVENTGLSDNIISCNKNNLLTEEMLSFLKDKINSFQNDILFTKEINRYFNKLLLNYPHYHSDQEQLEINNSTINNSHLFSNQISINHINKNIVNINLDDIRNNPKYSFLLHMSRENILNSNMLVGRIIRQSLSS